MSGAWGYGGMYGIIAIVFARKKVLRVVRTKGIVPLSTEHGTKNGTHTAIFQNAGGGGGVGCVAGPGPAAPPPGVWCVTRESRERRLHSALSCQYAGPPLYVAVTKGPFMSPMPVPGDWTSVS